MYHDNVVFYVEEIRTLTEPELVTSAHTFAIIALVFSVLTTAGFIVFLFLHYMNRLPCAKKKRRDQRDTSQDERTEMRTLNHEDDENLLNRLERLGNLVVPHFLTSMACIYLCFILINKHKGVPC